MVVSETVVRQAQEIRVLLDRGLFAGLRVPLRNGRTLPAELFAQVVLSDLDRLEEHGRTGGDVSDDQWQRLDDNLQLLRRLDVPLLRV